MSTTAPLPQHQTPSLPPMVAEFRAIMADDSWNARTPSAAQCRAVIEHIASALPSGPELWALWHVEHCSDVATLCEFDGSVCYECYRDEAEAQGSAARLNADGYSKGGRYIVARIPAGVAGNPCGSDLGSVRASGPVIAWAAGMACGYTTCTASIADLSAPAPVGTALPEIARRFAPSATAPLTHIIHFTIPRCGSADERILAETPVGDTAASVVEYLGTDQLNDYVLTAVYAADLTPGALALTDVTAAILRDVAAYVEAAAIELPRSLDDAFTRHGIPQPMAWVEANALRDLDFESERLGPADCLDRRAA